MLLLGCKICKRVFLDLRSLDDILKCDHSSKSYSTFLNVRLVIVLQKMI